jgi:Type IV secretion system pilin
MEKFFRGKYFLFVLFTMTLFLGAVFFTRNVLAQSCAGGAGACKDFCDLLTDDQKSDSACTLPNPIWCCVPKTASGSCVSSGGTCPGAGVACTPPATSSGSCTLAEGGGNCCKSSSTTGGGGVAIKFTNPLAYNTVEEVLNSILGTLRSIIVTLALVFLVVGAVLYITSAGNEGTMKIAKGAITAAMIGLAIGLAAPSFLLEIGRVLGWGAVNAGPVAGARTLSQIALSVLQFLLSIVGILAVIMLVVGGIMYLTAAGSEERVETGKKIVLYSIIGIFVALAALVIVSQIASFFI